MYEKTNLELIVKGDEDNIIVKTYESDQIPALDVMEAIHLWGNDPTKFGLLLRTYCGSDERSVVIEF